MKLLVDLFACQSPSRLRGIGRYSLSLVGEMAKLRGNQELAVLADALYPESFEELRQTFIRWLPSGAFLPYFHESLQNSRWRGTPALSKIAETLIEQAYQMVKPDVLLTPSFFDGWGGWEPGMVPLPDKDFASPKRAAILYDIIPYIFRERYLDPDPPIQKWYLERAGMLKKFDLLLAISESTRQDAIDLLGIDPERVVNISAAANPQFRRLELSEAEKRACLRRFGISRPFVLYIGGNDFRKNMDGAIRAFAHLPYQLRSRHQLVLNDVGDESFFRNKAHKLGLSDAEFVIASRITDEELTILYNLCALFIFPSLYEGFGLPVLEAMACGAPVLAANNSSLPEVVGRTDALFDASDDQAVADKMCKVLTEAAFRAELAAYGPERAKHFSWENSARCAWQAIESIPGEEKTARRWNVPGSALPSLRIAYVSPLPPQKSGIAGYSSRLLPYLRPYFDIDLFVEPGLEISDAFLKEKFSIHPWTELPERRDYYDCVIYHMGNSEFHIPMLRLLQEVPGIVVAHDFFESNLSFVEAIKSGDNKIFFDEMDASHGLRGLVDTVKNGIEAARWAWPMNWKVLKYAQEIIVHSHHQSELVNKYYAHGWKPSLTVINQFRENAPTFSDSQKAALRDKLGLDPCAFIYCAFGFMAPTKLNNPTIQAFAQILPDIQGDSMLVFVGDLEGGEYGIETLEIINGLKLNKQVRITGFVSDQEYQEYLACADVAIQLRTDSRGETSRAVLDCMAFGLPVIMNAHGSLKDYPAQAVVRLPGIPDVDEIARAMLHLQTDAAFRSRKGRSARNLVIQEHDPEKAAAEYAEVILAAAGTREHALFAPLVESIRELGSPDALLQSSARYAAANLALRCRPRILLDATGLEASLDPNTGQPDLSGAVIEIIRGLFASNDKSLQVELVHENEGGWVRACRLAEKLFELPDESLGSETPLLVRPGDVLLLNDQGSRQTVSAGALYEQVRQAGGKVLTMLFGAVPGRLEPSARESDMLLCSSQKHAGTVFASLALNSNGIQRPLDILFPSSGTTRPPKEPAVDQEMSLLDADDRSGLLRMVRVDLPARKKGLPGLQGLLESGAIFTAGFDPAGGKAVPEREMQACPDNQRFRVEMDSEQITLVSCSLSTPNTKGFSIVVQEDGPDPIVSAILENTFNLPEHYQMLFDLARPHGYVLDLGAHIGTFSLMAGANGYHVCAVEASPRNAAFLNESIHRNGFKNIQLAQAAVSDRTGVMDFYQDGPYGMLSNARLPADKPRMKVPSITVDDLLARIHWQSVDMIKMDIEGSELNAILGMPRLLSMKEAPPLLFESNGHTLHMFRVTPGKLFSALEGYGYQCYHFYDGQLIPIGGQDLQLECVADCLAVKSLPENFAMQWEIAPALSLEGQVKMALGSLTHPNEDVRAYIGRTLKQAGQALLGDARIGAALEALKTDPERAVRRSVAWWQR